MRDAQRPRAHVPGAGRLRAARAVRRLRGARHLESHRPLPRARTENQGRFRPCRDNGVDDSRARQIGRANCRDEMKVCGACIIKRAPKSSLKNQAAILPITWSKGAISRWRARSTTMQETNMRTEVARENDTYVTPTKPNDSMASARSRDKNASVRMR